ncbi:TonB-dependent receptor [Marinicauda salina]|uniref:TonB-dependent receptor n=1 Tax=Marinicauda salina TaxID=2135793 RepID=A0A2U2BVQ0_9PROT|nr:TonB-dependent receptor [Marinicauda salina]PWE18070.1 TonB-dependent receptor [Marinicauda salina]
MTLRSVLLAGVAPALFVLGPGADAFGSEHVVQRPEQPPEAATQDVIVVTGYRLAIETSIEDRISPEQAPVLGPDAAGLVARLPGAALIDNGAVSGQVQYRGLFGPRAPVAVDGAAVLSGGPNLMDPPLHYAPMPLVERIEVDRGVAAVSRGPGLGGGVNVVLKSVDFADGHALRPSADMMTAVRSVDGSYAAGGVAGLSSEGRRIQVLFSREAGGDAVFPGGDIPNSGHERTVFGIGGGVASGDHAFDLSWRRLDTGPTGNAPFAMDINFVDTDIARATYEGAFGALLVDAAIGWTDVAHGMDNFTQRPLADPMRRRFTRANADAVTAEFTLGLPVAGGDLELGVDREEARHDVTITNPDNREFFVETLPDIAIDRTGAFAEWTGAVFGLESELGVRLDRHEESAGEADLGSALPMGPRVLAASYNLADRDNEETTMDAVARFWRETDGPVTWRLTLARKTRMPGYVERFAWLPTPASGGLADGNTYVGDLDLDPETAWSVEAGVDWRGDGAYVRPTVYYRRVDDFIQGVPFDATPGVVDSPTEMVSAMNGDPTPLRFANVDAEFVGADIDFGWRIAPDWRIDGVASWVRGERRDIDDALYRMAPPRLLIDLTWDRPDWSLSLESRFVAEQDRVSATNDEAVTPGHVVLGIGLDWYARDNVLVSLGVENLLDEDYERHLAGYNRVADADVPVGARLPGAGRGVYARVSAGF